MPKESVGYSNGSRPVVLYFDQAGKSVSTAGMVQLVKNLFAVSVHNTGNTNVLFNDDTLIPGESKIIGGHWGMIYTGRCYISFQLPTPAPATPNNLCFITQLFYVPAPLKSAEDLKPILGI